MELPEHEVKAVRQYVESQTRDADNPVALVQKVGSRRVMTRSYDLYDVWMKDDTRWWVITDPTNLYAQQDFHSVEQAFTYHLGIGLVLADRGRRGHSEEGGDVVSGAWRRFTKAADAMDDATESEDFQSVGIRCREALLALVRDHCSDDWLGVVESPPKLGDFKAWMHLFLDTLSMSRPRRYLKALAERTWDLTVWLQHYVDATEWDAELVLDATAHFLGTFNLAIARHERGARRRCPRCESYRVEVDGHLAEQDGVTGWWSQDVCAACNWRGDEKFDAFTTENAEQASDYFEQASIERQDRV